MNVYSKSLYTTVDILSNKALNISNLLYRRKLEQQSAKWDPFISSHSAAGQALKNLTDSHSLVCSIPALSVPTYYSDIQGYANTVIDLIFLSISYAWVSHHIELDLRQLSDHTPLIVDLLINPENICVCRIVLKCNSK